MWEQFSIGTHKNTNCRMADRNGQSEIAELPTSQLFNQTLIPLYFGAANPNIHNTSFYIAVWINSNGPRLRNKMGPLAQITQTYPENMNFRDEFFYFPHSSRV